MLLSVHSLAIFCDYYNRIGECEWHYRPCGQNSSEPKTCGNLLGADIRPLQALEGTNSMNVMH